MGCFRRILAVCVVFFLTVTALLSLLVLGSAGVLGDAALISADDALFLVVLNALSLLSIVVLILILWQGSRHRSRLEKKIAELEQMTQIADQPSCGFTLQNDMRVPSGTRSLANPSMAIAQYCRNCGTSLDSALSFCPGCGMKLTQQSG